MDISKILPQGKASPGSEELSARKKKSTEGGLVGLVNIGNSCYMNSTLQALSNCPPFRHYFTDCYHPSTSSHQASDVIAVLFKKMWTSERHPGHLSPRSVSSAMTNKMFRGSLQQDAQEFLRCLLTQLHDEIGVQISERKDCGCGHKPCDSCCQRNSMTSYVSHDSDSSNDSQAKLVGATRHSPPTHKASSHSSPSSRRSSPSNTPKFSLKPKPYSKIVGSAKSSTESLDCEQADEPPVDLNAVYLADMATRQVSVHKDAVVDSRVSSEASVLPSAQPARKTVSVRKSSIVSEVFEGILESRVKCSACKKVSVTREPFQDLSLPIPGRKEVAKYKVEKSIEEKDQPKSTLNRGFCSVWSFVTALTRDILVGPPTDIGDCLNAFFDASELKGDNRYHCSHCKSFQNSTKEMSIVKLPDVLCIHLKRFRFDAYFSGKISRHIAFPLSGLDMSPYLKQEESVTRPHYELSTVITHYGGAGGGHYVAFAKNTPRNAWYEFNDTHVHSVSPDAVVGAEGYVLFYRRVPPSASQASLEIVSLMPRAGMLVPSPEVCYISRHWLHLLKHCANPGPIFQHEFACRHGGVLPGVSEESRALAVAIRREVWETLQQQYGGGPLVSRLEVCTTCQEHLKALTERRKNEKDTVQKLNTKGGKKPEPYLVSVQWLQQWQQFIKCSTLEVESPGPIDNTALLLASNSRLVKENSMFRRLPAAIWSFLHDAYGGGPTIVTSIDDSSSSSKPSEPNLC